MVNRAGLSVALEAISYQGKSSFFPDLTMAIQRLKDSNDYTTNGLEAVGVNAIIKRHTGLNVAVKMVTVSEFAFNAYANVPILSATNPFLNYYRGLLGGPSDLKLYTEFPKAKLKQFQEELTGTIDLQRGRVSGFFSSLPTELALGRQLVELLEADEIAATLLHEIGHLFTYFWILTHTVSSNLAIGIASDRLSKTPSPKLRLQLIAEFEEATGQAVADREAVANQTLSDAGYAAMLVHETSTRSIRTEAGAFVYDMSGSEYIADQFAVMWGSARAYVSGSEKMLRYNGSGYNTTMTSHLLTEACKWAAGLTATLLGGFVAVTAPNAGPLLLVVLAIPALFIIALLDGSQSYTQYDTTVDRIHRVRQSLIQVIKDVKLDPVNRKQILEDIDFIEKVLGTAKDHRSFFELIWTSLSPARRRQRNTKVFQKELETMINNNLFVSAGKLRQLSVQGA